MNIQIRDLHRDIPKAQLYYLLTYKSVSESLLDTITDCFYIRDHRHGRGERALGRMCFNWIADVHPAIFLKLIPFIPEYGRWDDLLYITNPQVVPYIYFYIQNQIQTDRFNMSIGLPISTCAKWLPTEGKSFVRRHKRQFQALLRHLNITPKEYRIHMSVLRKYLQLPEHIVCSAQSDARIKKQLTQMELSNGARKKYSKIYSLVCSTDTKPPFSSEKRNEYYIPIVNSLKI